SGTGGLVIGGLTAAGWVVGGLGRGVIQGVFELLLVPAGRVERVAAAGGGEGQPGGLADVVLGYFGAAVPGGQGDGGPGGDQVGAHAVDAEPAADRADLAQRGVGQDDLGQAGPGGGDGFGQRAGLGLEAGGERG